MTDRDTVGRIQMQTELIVENGTMNESGIRRAAELLKSGRLVAIPTETVYGLAANALDETAVRAIFQAKGRPQDNPLIVHVAGVDWIDDYVSEVPDGARELMEAFWPGPLTIIMKKSRLIPDVVSAGLETAAFRFPSHPVAAEIIRRAGIPLAAPSANQSGSPSPTKASHVLADLSGKIDAVVDGGDCGVGVESTVIVLHDGIPRILRPGGVTAEQLKEVLGSVEVDPAVLNGVAPDQRVASPGMKYKHYAPKANVIIVRGNFELFKKYLENNRTDGLCALCFDGEDKLLGVPCVTYGAAGDGETQARELFDALRRLDLIGARTVYARGPVETGVGLAVYNRLLRAAAFQVVTL